MPQAGPCAAVHSFVRPAPVVLLVDPEAQSTLADRLQLQGFAVVQCRDGSEAAIRALESPPSAVVADLMMPSISGVQLCRLLRSESGTSNVPVVLRGAESRRNRFWAEQAGASAYVVKGRMGELVRALRRELDRAGDSSFFVYSSTDGLDVRDRIAANLDSALFESVIASEVQRLATCESFERLVDLLSQFVSQVTSYRWLAVSRNQPLGIGVHANASTSELALGEARAALGIPNEAPLTMVHDDDASSDVEGPQAIREPIPFGERVIGSLALAPRAPLNPSDPILVRTIARELGGALRMATLVEESRRMASTDGLTSLLNRRAFLEWAVREAARSERYGDTLSVVMLDVDHFKQVNDHHGHGAGDAVLTVVAKLLRGSVRSCDVVARWGGEEFVIALPCTPGDSAVHVAERIRGLLADEPIADPSGARLRVTASFGVAQLRSHESFEQAVDRADRAMYSAKSAGRNRVVAAGPPSTEPRVVAAE